jgi:hypothetical protein
MLEQSLMAIVVEFMEVLQLRLFVHCLKMEVGLAMVTLGALLEARGEEGSMLMVWSPLED